MRKWGKFNAKKTVVDGIKFDSKKESMRYQELRTMQENGLIEELELQIVFELQRAFVNGIGKKIRPITYVADFSYLQDGNKIVEDCKGFITPEYKLKKKLFEHMYYPLTIKET